MNLATMTTEARIGGGWPGKTLASRVARVHPRWWLRALRNGTLAMIGLAGLLCLLVSYQAHREIATATGDGEQAISEVMKANVAIGQATNALGGIAASAVPLGGPGNPYVDSYTSATQLVTLTALHNVAGHAGAADISTAGGLLVTYDDQARQAMTDYVEGHQELGATEVGYLQNVGVQSQLAVLLSAEQGAARAELGSWWLRPGYFWWLLLTPFLAMLLAAVGTSYLLWRGFQRLLSVRLTLAAAAMLALVVFVAALNVHDGGRAKAFMAPMLGASLGTGPPRAATLDAGLAYSPLTLAVGLVLVAVASAAAYAAYRPRLEEYRYRP
jgi:hypothetical protein